MATWIKLKKDSREKLVTTSPQSRLTFTTTEIMTILGSDFKIFRMLWDDLLILRSDYQNPTDQIRNELASIYKKEDVYGDAILCSPKEFVE